MKKTLPYLFLINCFFSFSQTPSFEWANTNGGVSDQINSSRVLTDASNNIFVAGNFNGTVDFDPGIASNNVTWVFYWSSSESTEIDPESSWAQSFVTGSMTLRFKALSDKVRAVRSF